MHGTYAWQNDPDSVPCRSSPCYSTLSDISLSVPKGALCMVVGAVGSGKSSLLAAMLGEMHSVRGSAVVNGTVAYTSQVRSIPRHCICMIRPVAAPNLFTGMAWNILHTQQLVWWEHAGPLDTERHREGQHPHGCGCRRGALQRGGGGVRTGAGPGHAAQGRRHRDRGEGRDPVRCAGCPVSVA